MRVLAIQSSNHHYNKLSSVKNQKMTNHQTPSFKGESDGPALYGAGIGLIGGLVAVCTAPISIPVLLGAATVIGTGAAGMGLGLKLSGKKNNNKEDGSGNNDGK